LSNEPGGRVRLEWVEIYNQSDMEIDLGDYILIADADINELPAGIMLNPKSCAVLARQAVPEDGSDSFEGFWGDSSGAWGDSEIEDYLLLDVAMSLNNNFGSVILADRSLGALDSVSWTSASDDGRSLERTDVEDTGSGWHDCYDPDGSTPGKANSLIPAEGENGFHVAVEPVALSRGDFNSGGFHIDVIIPPGARLSVSVHDETGYKVRSLAEEIESAVSVISWDGKNGNSAELPPGIYILSFALSGQESETINRAVVIAP
jgi:hypothetical protein